MDNYHEACQKALPKSYSRLASPWVAVKLRSLLWHLRREGASWTLNRIIGLARRRFRRPPQGGTSKAARLLERTDEVLDLQPGEWVEVKPEDEIAGTLDAGGKTRGLNFLDEMHAFCGRRLRVYKRMERVFLEESQQYRSLKHTVLLSGAVCTGVGSGCDRSCLYYWREVWLRRVGSPKREPGGPDLDPVADGRCQGDT